MNEPDHQPNRIASIAGISAVLLFATAFRTAVINEPFYFSAESMGCSYGVMARNFLRFDWSQTRGMPVLSVAQEPGGPLVFYPSHPPLVPLAIAPVYALAGVGEWQTRLPTAGATLAAILALYLVLARWSAPRAGLIAAAVYAAMPMALYYGGMPEVVSVPLTLFAVLAVAAYVDWVRGGGGRAFARLVIWFALAAVSDWPAFFLAPVLCVHFVATQPRERWGRIVGFGAITAACFVLLYGYVVFATGAPWDWMAERFQTRAGINAGRPYTLGTWLEAAWRFNLIRHTWPVLAVAFAWIVLRGWRRSRRAAPEDRAVTFCRLLLAWAVLHVLIGREGVFVHEWWWSPLTPGLAVAVALMLDAGIARAQRRGLGRVAGIATAAVLVVFATWTSRKVYGEFVAAAQVGPVNALDWGDVIRAVAPAPDNVVALVHSSGDPQLWFYGDRSLKPDVWSSEDLRRRFRDGFVDLVYGYRQPWDGPPSALIFPLAHARTHAAFLAEMQQRYPALELPAHLAGKFSAFDLRPQPTSTRHTTGLAP